MAKAKRAGITDAQHYVGKAREASRVLVVMKRRGLDVSSIRFTRDNCMHCARYARDDD